MNNTISKYYPLTKNTSKWIFFSAIILNILVIFTICTDIFTSCTSSKNLFLYLFILFLYIGVISYSICNDTKHFLTMIIFYSFAFSPMVIISVFHMSNIAFIFLSIVCISFIFLEFEPPEQLKRWELITTHVYSIWVVFSSLVSFGRLGIFNYLNLQDTSTNDSFLFHDSINLYINIRHLLTSIIILIIVINVLKKTLKINPPKVNKLPSFFSIPQQKNTFSYVILAPAIQFVIYLLNLTYFIINSVWVSLITLLYYLYNFSIISFSIIIKLFFNKAIISSIFKVFLSYSIFYTSMLILGKWGFPNILKYLTVSKSLFESSITNIINIVLFSITCSLLLNSFRIVIFGFKNLEIYQSRTSISTAAVFFSSSFAGIITHIIVSTFPITIIGFKHIGFFVALVLLIMIILSSQLIVMKLFSNNK